MCVWLLADQRSVERLACPVGRALGQVLLVEYRARLTVTLAEDLARSKGSLARELLHRCCWQFSTTTMWLGLDWCRRQSALGGGARAMLQWRCTARKAEKSEKGRCREKRGEMRLAVLRGIWRLSPAISNACPMAMAGHAHKGSDDVDFSCVEGGRKRR